MRQRHPARIVRRMAVATAVVLTLAVTLVGQAPNTSDKPAAKATPTASRTPWGDPDLQGVWDFRTTTPLERPAELAGKETLTEAEAAEYAAKTVKARNRDTNVPEGNVGDYNNFWYDYGNKSVGTRRTALITDPKDGKIPPLTPEAQKKADALAAARKGTGMHEPTPGGWTDSLGSNGLQVRCIVGFNSGPPMTPSAYNNNVQIVQTPGMVVLLNEMNHSARTVPLDNRPRGNARRWTGVSRGKWDGSTLVVETTNFLRETAFDNGRTDANLQLVERFTRSDANTIVYEFTVNDPTVYTRPWTVQMTMNRSDEHLYEYACHEGNRAMTSILAGARAKEKQKAAPAAR
jgi:hypothetical protein